MYIYIFTVTTCAFIIKGIAGFGDPLISSPLLSMRMDNREITPGLLPVSLALNAYISWKNRKRFQLRAIAPVAVWVLLGIIPGTMLLKLGAPWILKAVLGVYIVGLGIEMLSRDRTKECRPNATLRAVICFLSGVMSGLFGINMLFLAYLERTSKDRNEFRGSLCFVFFLENLVRLIVYCSNGIFTPMSVKLSLICIPSAVIGMWIGNRIDKRTSEEKMKHIIIYVFILGGISAIIKAVMDSVQF